MLHGQRYVFCSSLLHILVNELHQLQINVEKTIDYVVDEEGPYTPAYQMEERSTKHLTSEADKRSFSPA